jgi:septal ring factor EnvC (AmiA/AmiB activator)
MRSNRHQAQRLALVLLGFLLIMGTLAWSQKGSTDRKSLEARQKRLKEQIALNQKLLDEARKNKAISLNEINLLNNQIRRRRELLGTIQAEISQLNGQLLANEAAMARLELEIARMKTSYAKMIYYSYKMRESDDRLLYLLASENLNQAWNRVRFLQRMASGRKNTYEKLAGTKEEMLRTTTELRIQVAEKERLRTDKSRESQQLTVEKERKGKALTLIQREENKIVADIRKKQREASELENRISQIIKKEIQKTAERKTEVAPAAREASAAEIKLSNTFAANKGKLPWPVERGTISGTFGTKKHPDFDVYTENNGIDFLTTTGSEARAVFDGEVSEVIQLPSYYAVLVKHGDYFTLYSKLQSVGVKKGQKVTLGQHIGLVKTGDHGTEFHFEVWHGRNKQNPQLWLRR